MRDYSLKYVTLEGEEAGSRKCDREEGGKEHVTSHLWNFFIIHMKPDIESDV